MLCLKRLEWDQVPVKPSENMLFAEATANEAEFSKQMKTYSIST